MPASASSALQQQFVLYSQLVCDGLFQRQFQNGEGAAYFRQFVPWIDESAPSVPGLRKQVVESLKWLEVRVYSQKNWPSFPECVHRLASLGLSVKMHNGFWMQGVMAEGDASNSSSVFIGGFHQFTAADLQLYTTMNFMQKPRY